MSTTNTPAPHGRYRVGLTVFWRDGERVNVANTLVIPCPCEGPHRQETVLEAKTTHPEGMNAWIVTGDGPDAERLVADAQAVAAALNEPDGGR